MERRRRRIIYNDDGDAQFPEANPQITRGPRGLLDARFRNVLGTQVDSYFWYVKDQEALLRQFSVCPALGDADGVMVDACQENGMEVVATIRMNDTHDAFCGVTNPFKQEHPEFLIGREGEYPRDSIMYFHWSGFDFAHEEVRRYKLEIIRKVYEQHDYDGLELDFSRHPLFFKLGEEEEHLDAMTAFVEQVRSLVEECARERGKRPMLAMLVPETPGVGVKIGLDLETWLARGWVDRLGAGWGYAPYHQRVEECIEVGHKHGVPVYPNVNASAVMDKSGHQLERVRGIASNFLAKGADGVYLFNFFPAIVDGELVRRITTEVGERETLRGKDKLFGMIPAVKYPHAAYSSSRSVLPVSLVEGAPMEFFIGDDVEEESRRKRLREIRVITRLTGVEKDEHIAASVNGTQMREVERRQTQEPFVNQYPGTWAEEKGE